MIDSLIICLAIVNTEVSNSSLDFQNYEGYIYPEEKGGDYLEGPLSSNWVEVDNQEKKD